MPVIRAVIPRRSRYENTFAVVAAEVDEDFADEQPSAVHALFGGIQQAVTGWFQQTNIGRNVVPSNHTAFNIGDLAEWATDESLKPLLERQGIQRLSVETHSDSSQHAWEYDDRLMDDSEIVADTS